MSTIETIDFSDLFAGVSSNQIEQPKQASQEVVCRQAPEPQQTTRRYPMGFIDTNPQQEVPALQPRTQQESEHQFVSKEYSLSEYPANPSRPTSMTVEAAMELLKQSKIPFHRMSPYHLKIGALNFYPTSGKITVDSIGLVMERGIQAVIQYFQKNNAAKNNNRSLYA